MIFITLFRHPSYSFILINCIDTPTRATYFRARVKHSRQHSMNVKVFFYCFFCLFFFILIPFSYAAPLNRNPTAAVNCPFPGDTKIYSQGNACFSSTGLGFNTVGGRYTCGPVLCPGQQGSLPKGNTCEYKDTTNRCFAGFGGYGFNPSEKEGGCHYNQSVPSPITCPSSYQIAIKVQDSKGNPVKDVTIHVYDNGHADYILQTDAQGSTLLSSWSGDHVKITLSDAKFKDSTTTFDGYVNTLSLCGTQLGVPPGSQGQNAPCVFKVTVLPSPSPKPTPTASPTPFPTHIPSPTPTQTPRPTNTPTPSFPPTPTNSPTPSITPSFTPAPTQTPFPTPTATPTLTPTETPSPTPTFTPTPTVPPTQTPTPTTIPTPTPTATPQPTTFTLSVCPHGLGKCGDNKNPQSIGNLNPLHPQRTIAVSFVNLHTNQIQHEQTTVTYNNQTQQFEGNLTAVIAPDRYTVKIKMDQYLQKSLPDTVSITGGQTMVLPQVSLVSGDINNDNKINLVDYNLLISCYSTKADTSTCFNKQLADLTDDGTIDGVDYNLLIRELSTQQYGD